MNEKTKTPTNEPRPIAPEILDALLKDSRGPEDFFAQGGWLKSLVKGLLERAMHAERTAHLGYSKYAPEGRNGGNSRNGTSSKHVTGELGEVDSTMPRDRQSTCEPTILPKGQTRWTGFDDKGIRLYARGMSVRDIRAQLRDWYGVDVDESLISQVTDEVLEGAQA